MKHYRGNILLIELVIVILFFSLSQLVIVRVFAAAMQKTQHSGIVQSAIAVAQDTAERLRAGSGDMAAQLDELGFDEQDGIHVRTYDGFVLSVSLDHHIAPSGMLYMAELSALRDGEVILCLPCTRYEGDPP